MKHAKVFFLMFVLTALFILVGGLFGGKQGMIIAFAIAAVMNVASYWFSGTVVLKMYRAKVVDESEAPELYGIVRNLTTRAGLPMPKVAVIPQQQPNAFATGRNHKNAVVAVTAGLVQAMSREELEGVIAHELAHIKNYDMLLGTIAATLAGAIAFLPRLFLFSGRRSGGSGLALIAMLILPFAAMLIKMAMSRAKEYRADRDGAAISGNPFGLSNALRKLSALSGRIPMRGNEATYHMFIVQPFSGRRMAKWFSTHPPLEERIQRLESMTSL